MFLKGRFFIMNKFTRILMGFVILASLNGVAFADGNAFTPLDFNDSSKAAEPSSATKATSDAALDSVGNESIQNAILQIESAQAGIKNDLENYRAKYADVDAQYKLIKNERAVLKKQIKTIETRMNSLERNKQKLKKNMI